MRPDITIELTPIGEGRWKVLKDLSFTCAHPKHGPLAVNIKKGFITDLDTVPRIPYLYELYKERTQAAAVIHDWMYSKRIARHRADDFFLMLMEYEGVRRRYRLPIYYAVRVFGGINYPKKGELNA